MDLATRLTVLAVGLLVAGVGWAMQQRRRGRLRPASASADLPPAWAAHAGRRLTLVQISSEQCSACVRGARLWRSATASTGEVSFLEVDAAAHMDLVRELGILATPTTLVYDAAGSLTGRVTGAPTARTAAAVLAPEPEAAR